MNIVYYLLTHKNEGQVTRLVRRLQSSANSFVLIHHDAKSTPLALPSSDNHWVLKNPVEVQWGGISQVHAMWKGIEWLQSTKFAFDWMIFLSGQDYPIRPLSEVEAELEQSKFDGYLEHETIHSSPASHERYFHTLCWRRYFFKEFKIPGLRPRYVARRHPYVGGVKCLAGSPWLNLSRKAVESLWSRKHVTEALIQYLHNSPCPDETVLQTVVGNDSSLQLQNSCKRFIIWRDDANNPEILGLEHLSAILASDAWFARKLDDSVSLALFERLDEIVLGRDHWPRP